MVRSKTSLPSPISLRTPLKVSSSAAALVVTSSANVVVSCNELDRSVMWLLVTPATPPVDLMTASILAMASSCSVNALMDSPPMAMRGSDRLVVSVWPSRLNDSPVRAILAVTD